ncbi:hypothetical protein D3C81_569860 [compost metagenome]
MDTLYYVGIPKKWESPKGVIMRTALHNGYSSVATMCTGLEVSCNRDSLDLLTEQSSLVEKLFAQAPDIAQRLLSILYTTKGTNDSYWGIDNICLTRSEFARTFRYCPKCLQNELITVFQDLKSLMICPLHRAEIVNQCPICNQRVNWTEAHLFFCKCGFDRRNTFCKEGALLNRERLETFGENSYIRKLSKITTIALTSDDIWKTRSPTNEHSTGNLVAEVRQHAANMINTQIDKLPGFTQRMHLSPWILSHTLLVTLAKEIINKKCTFHIDCSNEACCSGITLKMNELYYSTDSKKVWPNDETYYSENFELRYSQTKGRYYKSHQPICKLVKLMYDQALILKYKKEHIPSTHLKMQEVADIVQCGVLTVRQLTKLGYLQTLHTASRSGRENPILIPKQSANEFQNTYILIGEISNLLKISPSKAIRLLRRLNMISDHDGAGPHIFKRCEIIPNIKKLATEAEAPSTPLMRELSPMQSNYNFLGVLQPESTLSNNTISKISLLLKKFEEIQKPRLFTIDQAAFLLDITSRLIHRRFVRTGLIRPQYFNETPYLSLTQIETISTHMQQHVSIIQITEILECGRAKAINLISQANLQPSCNLCYPDGDRQVLYYKKNIYGLIKLAVKKEN